MFKKLTLDEIEKMVEEVQKQNTMLDYKGKSKPSKTDIELLKRAKNISIFFTAVSSFIGLTSLLFMDVDLFNFFYIIFLVNFVPVTMGINVFKYSKAIHIFNETSSQSIDEVRMKLNSPI